MYLVGFPLLLIPFAIYNIVAFVMPGLGWAETLTRLRFPTGGEWTMSLGDMLVALSILLLLVEVIKAYRHGGRYLMDHGLSILLFLAMAAEFYLVPRATTAPFFLMMVASFADVVGGLVAMRRRPVPAVLDEEFESVAVPPAPPLAEEKSQVKELNEKRVEPVVMPVPAPAPLTPPPPVAPVQTPPEAAHAPTADVPSPVQPGIDEKPASDKI